MNRFFHVLIAILISSFSLYGQFSEPYAWKCNVEKSTVCINGIYYKYNELWNHFVVTDISDSIVVPDIKTEIFYNNTNYPVSEIDFSCYSGHNVKILHLPASIKQITRLKSYCLEQLYLPDSINAIEDLYCPRLNAIHVPVTNPFFTTVDGVLYNKDKTTLVRFPSGKKATAFKLPNSVTNIGKAAFKGCLILEKLKLNNSKSIEDEAFLNCYNLSDIQMPTFTDDTELELGDDVFFRCHSLKKLIFNCNVSIYNSIYNVKNLEHIVFKKQFDYFDAPRYCPNLKCIIIKHPDGYYTTDGVLYEKKDNHNSLMYYPDNKEGKTFIVPDSVTEIEINAFSGIKQLEKIVLPHNSYSDRLIISDCPNLQSIENLDKTLIYDNLKICNCPRLKVITLPDSLKDINVTDCDSLTIRLNNNPYFKLVDDVLYTSDMKTLVYYPPLKKDTVFSVPPSVREIGYWAITNANNLKEIIFHDSIQRFNGGYVRNCKNLRRYRVSTDNYYIHHPSGCPNLDSISLGKLYQRHTIIGGVLFSKDTTYLLSYPANKKDSIYVIPPSVTTIMSTAFNNNLYLQHIVIPASVKDFVFTIIDKGSYKVKTIESRLFFGCSALKSISVSPENEYIRSIDGVLYSKDGTELICYPANRSNSTHSFQIPPSVISIADHAFYGNKHLKELTIPSSVIFIGIDAFSQTQIHLTMESETPPFCYWQNFNGTYSVKNKKAKPLYNKTLYKQWADWHGIQ